MLSIYDVEGEESQLCSTHAAPCKATSDQARRKRKRASGFLNPFNRPLTDRLYRLVHLRLRPFRPCLLVFLSREWFQVMRNMRSARVVRLNNREHVSLKRIVVYLSPNSRLPFRRKCVTSLWKEPPCCQSGSPRPRPTLRPRLPRPRLTTVTPSMLVKSVSGPVKPVKPH